MLFEDIVIALQNGQFCSSQIYCHLISIISILYTPYISRGFYFREFRESGAIREFINTRKYLSPIPTHECDLCTQYIALLDRELTTRENVFNSRFAKN